MAITQSGFIAFYPQFRSFTPGVVLTEYIDQANARFSDFDSDAEEARRLFVAHKLTLYSASALPASETPTSAQLAAAGQSSQHQVTSKKVGEVSVTFGRSAAAGSAAALADLTETDFGLQLLSLLRIHSYPRYVP